MAPVFTNLYANASSTDGHLPWCSALLRLWKLHACVRGCYNRSRQSHLTIGVVSHRFWPWYDTKSASTSISIHKNSGKSMEKQQNKQHLLNIYSKWSNKRRKNTRLKLFFNWSNHVRSRLCQCVRLSRGQVVAGEILRRFSKIIIGPPKWSNMDNPNIYQIYGTFGSIPFGILIWVIAFYSHLPLIH